MSKQRLKQTWEIYRQVAAVRGLLEWLGMWKHIAWIASTVVTFLIARFSHVLTLARPWAIALTLTVFATTLILLIHIAMFVRSMRLAKDMDTQDGSVPAPASLNGPEIVLEYSYSEGSHGHDNPDGPVLLKNISLTAAAYNIEVLPLDIGETSCSFEPSLISHIVAQGQSNVVADYRNGSILFKRNFPRFLYRSYKDTSVEELFGVKSFTLKIRYNGTDARRFETRCELRFRPWKKQTRIGHLERITL